MESENKNEVIITAKLNGSDAVPIKVPPEGSLGLLALGYRGILAWRQVRNKAIAEEQSKTMGK